jgi:hypothetical protein
MVLQGFFLVFLDNPKTTTMWEEKLKIYDAIVAKCPRFKRKGKAVPSTTANGRMFSMLNKEGEIGIRFSKVVQEKYMKAFNTTIYTSYNSVMQGYILVTEDMLNNLDRMAELLDESYDYVMGLPPK